MHDGRLVWCKNHCWSDANFQPSWGSSRSYPCEHCYQWQSSQAINDVCAGSLNTKKAEYAASYASRCGFLGAKYLARVKIAAVCVETILPYFLS